MAEKTKKSSPEGSFEKVAPASFKKDEQLLKQFATLLVQGSEDAIIAEDLTGKIISWNPAAERMFGYTAQEVVGKPMEIIGTPDKKEEFVQLIARVKKGEKIERYETTRRHKTGKKILVSVTISPVKDDDGNIVGISAIDRDITQRKENAGYARSLIEASVDPLVTISQDGKITDVNEATVKATGAMKDELVGSVFSDYFTEPEKAEAGYKKVLQDGIVRDYPLTIKNKNGKLMDVLYNASTYKDADGKVIGVFAAARDITEQKQASQYARSLIEASLDPLVTISPEGKITDVNDATIKATGAEREELIGSRFSDYFTVPEKAEEGYQTVLDKGFVADYALTIKHKDGKLMDVLYNASVYKDVRGKVIGVFAAARDVTKSKQASQYARSLIEASVDPLVTISPEGKITDVNQATIQATGAPREELIGSVFSDYFTEPEKAESGYKKVLSESVVRDYPLTIKHKNGKLMDVLYNASVYKDVRGKVVGVFAAARDVTEQKQASQYARSLIEASLDPLVTISPDGKITDVNQATIDVTGVAKDQMIGSDFSFYFTEPEKARSGYQEAFKKGEVRDYLLTIRSRLGKETPVLYNASVYKDEKGKVLGVFAAAREISRSELKAARARELQRISKKIVFKVVVSRKLSSGNIKINEKDAQMLNIDLVDNVTIKPTRDDIAKNKFTALSMTESRLAEGVVLVGVADARRLGIEENDTAFVTKAGTDEEVELINVESYAAKPGEYDSPELESQAGAAGKKGIKAKQSTGLPFAGSHDSNKEKTAQEMKDVADETSDDFNEESLPSREKPETKKADVTSGAQESSDKESSEQATPDSGDDTGADDSGGGEDAGADGSEGDDDTGADDSAGGDDTAADDSEGGDDTAADDSAGDDDTAADDSEGGDDTAPDAADSDDEAAADGSDGGDDTAPDAANGEDEAAADAANGGDDTAPDAANGEDEVAADDTDSDDDTAADDSEGGDETATKKSDAVSKKVPKKSKPAVKKNVSKSVGAPESKKAEKDFEAQIDALRGS